MDPDDLDRRLTELLRDDVPTTVAAQAGALFDLRSPTGGLADVVEVVEVSGIDDSNADRIFTFAGGDQVVVVAVSAADRRAVGRVDPARSASITFVAVDGTTSVSHADEHGVFEVDAVPPGRVRIIVETGGSEHGRTLRTAWAPLSAASSVVGVRPQAPEAARDELGLRRLAARATSALARYQAGLVDGLLDGQRPVGRLEPPGTDVSRALAPAAQQGSRQRPRHRWTSEDERLEVTLEESIEGRLTLTVLGSIDMPKDVVVSVGWSTTDTDGSSTDHQLATPLPADSIDRRAATYDVGSALHLHRVRPRRRARVLCPHRHRGNRRSISVTGPSATP